jgi:hypothetical protein
MRCGFFRPKIKEGVIMLAWIIWLVWMLPVVIFLVCVLRSRGKYKNRKGAGAFFFENDSLVLNTGLLYEVPFWEINWVELQYNSWELEHQLSYSLWVKVVRRDGRSKRVFYKGYGTAKLAYPEDMRAALEERGIRCVMTDCNKKRK